ncbi:uncharacterized protein PFL1_06325 [Pseudozyma flocculosa PF-1]|uniref:Related to TSR1 - protein involved in 20S rRNA accumulation n=2 Tax=Pseudozyma flocculosa TaxID=84751 RepID=A0A5C3F7I7_9BASI|nr:uncharacterized protein PFL1_06325 [Pseudozyma flocculosa PF-1]EPQ26117.1 hypothetical protein PFL1_06325 [Pseudozyma flocculosa PF-1]SPO40362.1 related to TSR1 - protein involved in 20S rRNA accumulation [Pseudozyma flocculosa]
MSHHHRASTLRQSNKPFKSRHSSKSALKEQSKGRAASAQDGGASRASSHKSSPLLSAAGNESGSRQHRKNLAKQAQNAKRAALVQSNRVFTASAPGAPASAAALDAAGGLAKGFAGAGGGAPRICAVVDLTEDGDAWDAVRRIEHEGDEGGVKPVDGRSVADALQAQLPFCELEALRFRQTIQFLPLPYGALYPILDACKCADFVLFILSASTSIEPGSWGELCLRTLQAQGLPTSLFAVPTLLPDGASGVGGSKKAGPTQKAANEARKSLLSFARYFAPDADKVHALDDKAERGALLRTLATSTPKRVAWRDFRAWTVSEGAEWVPSGNGDVADAAAAATATATTSASNGGGTDMIAEPRGTLKVQGWVRGAPLSANRLVHIPDFGDFEVERIAYAPPPNARTRRTKSSAVNSKKKAKQQQQQQQQNGSSAAAVAAASDDMADADMADETDAVSTAGTEAALVAGDVLDERDTDYADDLVSENEADDMENEQTWPTEEEMAAGEAFAQQAANGEMPPPPALPGTTPKAIQKKGGAKDAADDPKFRAAWIIESDGESDLSGDDDDDDDDDDDMVDGSGDEAVNEAVDDYEAAKAAMMANAAGGSSSAMASDAMSEMPFEDLDDEEAEAEYQAYQEQRKKERDARDDAEFPDEVDTPGDVPARTRFARYRGLKSFRTSPWDPYEDLPRDYARIFQFDDFHKTRRRVEASALLDGVEPGFRVEVWIRDVPRSAALRARAKGLEAELAAAATATATTNGKAGVVPFVLFGLLRHEHKKSVINFTVTRNTEYEEPVKSKDSLVLCLGPRRLRVNPIFSQHTRGGGKGVNNVHKFERFLRHGVSASVGTVYGPITFGGSTAPAVLLRERVEDGETGWDQRGVGARQMPHLVGFGNLIDAGPTRINAKRIVLSGHPYKVHKKTATIRFMFFNPEDVHYFAPIALSTKLGRTGHIVESLGTHGYFKAHFDGPISQMDTILLTLYKRVFPKWARPYRDSQDEMPVPVDEVERLQALRDTDADAMEA